MFDSNRCIVRATCGDAGRAIVGGLRRISKATANVAGSPVLSFSYPFSFSSSRCIFLQNREYSTNDSPAKLRHACKLSRASNSVSHRDAGGSHGRRRRGRVDLGFSRRAATAKARDANSLICKLMTAWLSRRWKLHRRAVLTDYYGSVGMKDEGCQRIPRPSTRDYHRRISTQNRHAAAANTLGYNGGKEETCTLKYASTMEAREERGPRLQVPRSRSRPCSLRDPRRIYVCELYVSCTPRDLTIARYITGRCSDCQ